MAERTFRETQAVRPEHLPHVDPNLLGVGLFISSESVFFLSLIASYVLYRGQDTAMRVAALDVPRTTVFTVFLLASSLTVWLASTRIRRDDRRGCQFWLVVTIVLGAIFLVGQATEYARLVAEQITPARNLFG